jgi:hypothetical protein
MQVSDSYTPIFVNYDSLQPSGSTVMQARLTNTDIVEPTPWIFDPPTQTDSRLIKLGYSESPPSILVRETAAIADTDVEAAFFERLIVEESFFSGPLPYAFVAVAGIMLTTYLSCQVINLISTRCFGFNINEYLSKPFVEPKSKSASPPIVNR